MATCRHCCSVGYLRAADPVASWTTVRIRSLRRPMSRVLPDNALVMNRRRVVEIEPDRRRGKQHITETCGGTGCFCNCNRSRERGGTRSSPAPRRPRTPVGAVHVLSHDATHAHGRLIRSALQKNAAPDTNAIVQAKRLVRFITFFITIVLCKDRVAWFIIIGGWRADTPANSA